jgi:hypothetical protein
MGSKPKGPLDRAIQRANRKREERRAKELDEAEERKQQIANIEAARRDWYGIERMIKMAVFSANERMGGTGVRLAARSDPTTSRPLPLVRITALGQTAEMTIGIDENGKVAITGTVDPAVMETSVLTIPKVQSIIEGFAAALLEAADH